MIVEIVLSVIGAAAGLSTLAWNVIQIVHRRARSRLKVQDAAGSAGSSAESAESDAASVIQRAYRRRRAATIKYGAFEFRLDETE